MRDLHNKRKLAAPAWALLAIQLLAPAPAAAAPGWASERRFRIRLEIDPGPARRSRSPAVAAIDFERALRDAGVKAPLDENSIEVIAFPEAAAPRLPHRLPHRLDRLYGSSRCSLAFVLPDGACKEAAVYFDTAGTVPSAASPPGLVGDGDLFREMPQRRTIAPSHFDQLVDFDGDGDLDFFQGGVEPTIECWENIGGNRMAPRGRLASGGEMFRLPCSEDGRSWVTAAFFDIDGDGDQDFFPSFNDGPDRGKFIFYRNVSPPGSRERGGEITFERGGALATASGALLAGGAQAGGWFPSITFVRGWDGTAGASPDALVGSGNRCWLYRGLGLENGGTPRFADAVAVTAGGREIELVNPRFDCADADGDGDLDLFAGSQPGAALFFRNIGSRSRVELAAGQVAALAGRYLIGDAHSGVKVADFDGDGTPELAAGRFWQRADLDRPEGPIEPGELRSIAPGAAGVEFQPSAAGAPFFEGYPPCDAIRQNSVRACDWDGDERLDLLAGDTDGHVWYFRNAGDRTAPLFEAGRKLRAGGRLLSVASSGGHARLDACDWNGDGRLDLMVASGGGTVTLFPGKAGSGGPVLEEGTRVEAGGKPIQAGGRASLLVCDWDGDGRKDLVLADDKGYYFLKNGGTDAAPLLAEPRAIQFGGKPVRYVRPNLGSFVDWDGDGRRDLIGCHFENSIRFYRNLGPASPGSEPVFSDPEGEVILRASSPQMISGADAVDWNGDGDLDLLTGQGHGGSGLRFFERDWIEDALRGSRPRVAAGPAESKPPEADYLEVVRRYADAMIERGRDVYGPMKTGLFLSALDRAELAPLKVRPAAPGGIRRGDRPGRAWSAMNGANPMLDQNLLRVLYALGGITGSERYSRAADEELSWFFGNALSPATSLLPWGEHLSWDVLIDRPISGGDEMMHEYARPWALWDRSFALAPEACRKFAIGLWEHQIADHKTGAFDRHAPYSEHGPVDGKDFARHAGFYIATWCYAWKYAPDDVFLRAIETLLARFEKKRIQKDGSKAATIGPLDCETAAALVPQPLAARLRAFAAEEDELMLPDLRRQVASHSGAAGAGPPLPPKWASGYSAGTLAGSAMFCLARHQQSGRPEYRELVIAIAGAYKGSQPEEDVDAWPLSFAHAISAEAAAYRFTGRTEYLAEVRRLAALAVGLFWQDSPLPRASKFTGHYETITGADSLALALLEAHAAISGQSYELPMNTIDR